MSDSVLTSQLRRIPTAAGWREKLELSTSADVAAFLAALLTTRGQIIRRGSSAPEALAASTANTFVGGDGTDVTTRTAAQVLTSLGYEVGTFTPEMAFATPGTSSWAYTTQTGIYLKFARFVWVFIDLAATPTIGTGSGNVFVTGLPVAADQNEMSILLSGMGSTWTWPAGRSVAYLRLASGSTSALLQSHGSAVTVGNFTTAAMTGGSSHTLRATGVYRVAS